MIRRKWKLILVLALALLMPGQLGVVFIQGTGVPPSGPTMEGCDFTEMGAAGPSDTVETGTNTSIEIGD